jgi:hypothetical protein
MTDPNPADPNAPEPTMGGSADAAPPPSPAPGPAPSAPPPPAPAAAAPASSSWNASSEGASSGGAAGARPTGITILAVLAAIGGILGLFGGFVVLLAGTAIFGGAGALLGIAALAYAGLLIAAAYGFWTLQPWAWPLGVAVAIFGIVISVLYILGGQSIASQILGIVVDGVILYYLNQPGIRRLFGR